MAKKKGINNHFDSFLNRVERIGNALPHPASLFGLLALFVLVLSWIGHQLDWIVIHPANQETIHVENLISRNGLHRIILEMVDNYTSFAPLGIVMVALLGIGIAESSGLIRAAIRIVIQKSPAKLITFVLVFTGVLSNMASDLGYVLIIPIGGIIFHSLGRNPLAGMAAAFAGVSGGFSANIFIGTIDPLLAGLSTEAAQILDPSYDVNPTANYYFMLASTFLVSIIGTIVTDKIIEPRLGTYKGNEKAESMEPLTAIEKKGLRYVLLFSAALIVLILLCVIPENGILRGPKGSLLESPLLKGFITVLFVFTAMMGIVYGIVTKTFKNDDDVVKGMTASFKSLATFLVLVFFAAQFVAYFKWSNLGLVFAVKGAHFLSDMQLGMVPLLVMFVILSGFLNMFMGSASAKWAILAPVFIPMFMLLGYSPELSQAVFRIGDSVTNVISPMMSFFALIIAYFQKYEPKAGLGTLISTMLPYSILFFIFWTLFLIAWVYLGIPLGPGSGVHYNLPL